MYILLIRYGYFISLDIKISNAKNMEPYNNLCPQLNPQEGYCTPSIYPLNSVPAPMIARTFIPPAPQGWTGPQGNVGYTGPQGEKGIPGGPQGSTGPIGSRGMQGYTGPAGKAGLIPHKLWGEYQSDVNSNLIPFEGGIIKYDSSTEKWIFTGDKSLAIGPISYFMSSKEYNIGIGKNMGVGIAGVDNIGLGQSLFNISAGNKNIAVGDRLSYIAGSGNISLGNDSGNDAGDNNIVLGNNSGLVLGNNNIILGEYAGYQINKVDNCVFLGNLSGSETIAPGNPTYQAPSNSIIINASSSALAPVNSGVYISSLSENNSGSKVMPSNIPQDTYPVVYNPITKELSYSSIA